MGTESYLQNKAESPNRRTVTEESLIGRQENDDMAIEERKTRSIFESLRKDEAQKYTSAGTSLNQIPAGFKATYKDKATGVKKPFYADRQGQTNLDLGGGKFDTASEYMKNTYEVENLVIDPFNRFKKHNMQMYDRLFADGRFVGADTVSLNNVLNVIDDDDEMERVIARAAKLVKPDGAVEITVYEGPKEYRGQSRMTKEGQFQRFWATEQYVPFIRKCFDDVQRHGKLIVAQKPKKDSELVNNVEIDFGELVDPEDRG